MSDYRSFCNKCGNEVGFGSHKPWCGKMSQEEYIDKELVELFEEIEFNILTIEKLYSCRKCYSVVMHRQDHLTIAHDFRW